MSHQLPKENLSTEQKVDGKEMFLVTAGGQIKCLRCVAKSSRTGVQCGRPALDSSKNQKCQYHGGAALARKQQRVKPALLRRIPFMDKRPTQ